MSKETNNKKHLCRIVTCALLLFLVISCDQNSISYGSTQEYRFYDLPFGRKALTVTNVSRWAADAQIKRTVSFQNRLQGKPGAVKYDLEEASRFNSNPPPVGASRAVQERALAVVNIGDRKQFWVTNASDQFITITAALRKQGAYCKVWIANNASYTENGNKTYISDSEAEELADTFDAIYPLATNLLGYEKGGGPDGDGGIDGDPDIQILIYNCAEDDVLGFFWGKDEYTQRDLNMSWDNRRLKSNEAEIFYINARFFGDVQTGSGPGSTQDNRKLIYSALVHEFQHMINFNRKALNLGKTSATWYDEMLSLLAEDIIGPMIGIDINSPGHPINSRIPLFLGLYWDVGVNEWLSSDDVILSYSSVYAFGAYLVRNYGGPALLKAMMDNNAVDETSISRALSLMNTNNVTNFEQALNNYAQALLYSTTKTSGSFNGKPSFDHTKESVINDITYTAEAFDIWDMQMSPELFDVDGFSEIFNIDSDYKGPVMLPYAARKLPLHAYSIFLLELSPNITGTWTTSLTVPFPSFAVINVDVVPY